MRQVTFNNHLISGRADHLEPFHSIPRKDRDEMVVRIIHPELIGADMDFSRLEFCRAVICQVHLICSHIYAVGIVASSLFLLHRSGVLFSNTFGSARVGVSLINAGYAACLTYCHLAILSLMGKKTVRTSLDIPVALHRCLHEAAAKQGCSARQLMLRSIEQAVNSACPQRQPRRLSFDPPIVRLMEEDPLT